MGLEREFLAGVLISAWTFVDAAVREERGPCRYVVLIRRRSEGR